MNRTLHGRAHRGRLLTAVLVAVVAVTPTWLIGTQAPDDKPAGSSSPTAINTTVTLSLTPEMAPRIMVAEVLGTMRLSLRKAGDNTASPAVSAQLNQLLQPLNVGAVAGPR